MESSRCILVVDDEPRGVEVVQRALLDLGEVATALSGEEGWAIASQGGVDLVIADQRMPGMSGVELLTRVAELRETTGRILLTAYADMNAAIDAINGARVHAYVSKPCPPERIRETARSVLFGVDRARGGECLLRALAQEGRRLEALVRSLREDPTEPPSGAAG